MSRIKSAYFDEIANLEFEDQFSEEEFLEFSLGEINFLLQEVA
jgi:hypothetical protein